MASAFRRASSISSSSVPLQRTRHGPEDSQKASPKAAPGTAVTSASCRSSTVLMKCAWPRIRLTASGFSIGTTTRLTDMTPPGPRHTAPTVTVRIKQGFCVTASAARSFPPGSIFLDGAAQGEPFIDPKRQLYNLDHHEGCVRSFTLATCEQAVVLVRKGLDLRRRDWTVYANDADLDTVLAIWVLLNHIRLNEIDGQTRARIMPLLRLQGAIDAQGLELSDLCGLPPKLLADTQAWIDDLRARDLALTRCGQLE